MQTVEVLWRTINALLAISATYLLVRLYARYWSSYARPDRQLALGVLWLLATVVIGSVENIIRDFEPGPRTVALTLALVFINIGLTRMAIHRHRDRQPRPDPGTPEGGATP